MSVSVWCEGLSDPPNFSNRNFTALMELVGLDQIDWGGTWTATELPTVREKILFALESLTGMPDLDGGTPSETSVGKNGCRLIVCGMPAGYFVRRLSDVERVLSHAIDSKKDVHWG